MSTTTWSENIARFLMVFGLFIVITHLGASFVKADLVGDVWEQQSTFQDPRDPATTTDPEVRADWQDAQTIGGYEQTLRMLGLGSILTAIILTFAIVIYRGVKVMREIFPQLWRRQLARWTGHALPVPQRETDDVELPFGGGA